MDHSSLAAAGLVGSSTTDERGRICGMVLRGKAVDFTPCLVRPGRAVIVE
jgi:hypothetical protein